MVRYILTPSLNHSLSFFPDETFAVECNGTPAVEGGGLLGFGRKVFEPGFPGWRELQIALNLGKAPSPSLRPRLQRHFHKIVGKHGEQTRIKVLEERIGRLAYIPIFWWNE